MTRVAKVLGVVWSALVTVGVLGGAAAALMWWASWPLPHRWPSAEEWGAFADQPLTYPVVKAIVACAAWLVWLLLTLAVGIEVWMRVSQRPPRIRLPRLLRLLAAGLAGGSVVAVAGTAHAAEPSAATTPATTDHLAATSPAARSTSAASVVSPAATQQPTPDPHGDGSIGQPAAPGVRTGVAVPGGWIAWPVAAGVLAAAAIALLRGYHPRHGSSVVRAIRAARHPALDPAAEQPLSLLPSDDIGDLERDATTAAGPAIGLTGSATMSFAMLPHGGVGFTGPGTADALRAILATAAVTAEPVTVVIPRALLTTLINPVVDLRRIIVATDIPEGVRILQAQLHQRGTTSREHNPGNTPSDHAPLVLLTPSPSDPRRLSALAELGHELNIHIIVAGVWPPGVTWHIDSDGHTTRNGTPIGRLNILNEAALTQIVGLLQPATRRTAEATLADHQPPMAASQALPFRLAILGRPQLATPTSSAVHIRRSGSWQLAVYLALQPDGVTRADLLETIFGHLKQSTATASLNTCLYELRRALIVNGHTALLTIDDRHRLDPALITVDWWQLEADLRRGNYEAAIARYTGPLADGHSWDWLPEHRQTARHIVADAHVHLANVATTPQQALDYALAGINIDPHALACYEAAIHAHHQMGNPDRAHILHNQLVRKLELTGDPRQELGSGRPA